MYNLTNATLPVDLLTYGNNVTGGWFWQLILLALYFVIYITMSYTTSTMRSFTVMGFIGGIAATFMYAIADTTGATLIPYMTWIIAMVVMLASFVMMLFSQGQRE
jgi:hypothetical protein